MQIAGLADGRGLALEHVAEAAPGDARLAVVAVDDADAPIARAAAGWGVSVEAVGGADEIAEVVDGHGADLVLLDGSEVELRGEVLGALPPVVGLHRSLLPAFPGGDPVPSALEAGVRIAGGTAHLVAPDGSRPVLAQEPVPVFGDDDVETLTGRIDAEAIPSAVSRALASIADGTLAVDGSTVVSSSEPVDGFDPHRLASDDRLRRLRYGENPHQAAALYVDRSETAASVVDADERNPGAKALSYNNINDADAALGLVAEFDRPAAAVIKHTNPAGCATAETLADAYDRALRTDPMSAFGGIVALNRECDAATAGAVVESFKEVVIAPSYTTEAEATLGEKENLRVLAVGDRSAAPGRLVETPVTGGRLVQERDDQRLEPADLEVVTDREPTPAQVETMCFAWQTVKHVKSNAIVLATGTETVGIGMGQVSRVDAVRLAALKADEHAEGKSAAGAVMASDAFFPFPDGVEVAAEAGVEAVVQPGGSVNDESVIAAADEHGLAMAFTGRRAFRHG